MLCAPRAYLDVIKRGRAGAHMDDVTTPAEARARTRGELAAVYYAIPVEKRAASNCPAKHGLVQFTTERVFACNLCEKRVRQGSAMRGCRSCDYDVCEECVGAAEEVELRTRHLQLPRSTGSYDEVLATARDKAKQRKVELDYVDAVSRQATESTTQEQQRRRRSCG